MFHVCCNDRRAAKRCSYVRGKPSLVCVVYNLAHPAVAPTMMEESYYSPTFPFGVAATGDDLVGEVTEVCVYVSCRNVVSGAKFAG